MAMAAMDATETGADIRPAAHFADELEINDYPVQVG